MSEVTTYEAGEDGWCAWVSPKMTGYKMVCCDCDLTHEVDFKVVRFLTKSTVFGNEICQEINDENIQILLRMRRAIVVKEWK